MKSYDVFAAKVPQARITLNHAAELNCFSAAGSIFWAQKGENVTTKGQAGCHRLRSGNSLGYYGTWFVLFSLNEYSHDNVLFKNTAPRCFPSTLLFPGLLRRDGWILQFNRYRIFLPCFCHSRASRTRNHPGGPSAAGRSADNWILRSWCCWRLHKLYARKTFSNWHTTLLIFPPP